MTRPLPPGVPLLFLDLDGTVRHGKDELGYFVNRPEDVVIFPEALVMMRRWKEAGGRIVAISNQGGIALGHVAYEDVVATMERTYELTEGLFDRISWCSHHPDAVDLDNSRCWCRKPLPGLIFDTVNDLSQFFGEYYPPYMAMFVGDREEDRECARLANIEFQWAKDWRAMANLGTPATS